MTIENYYKDINHIVHITTDDHTACKECASNTFNQNKIADAINHYISQHGYKLLHVGSETTRDDQNRIWHNTVAILGK